MALISCTECGKEISEKAKSCPFCGAPTTFAKNQIEEKKATSANDSPFCGFSVFSWGIYLFRE